MDYALFIITFASVCFLPGVCMSLTLSLGISIGFRRSLSFMCGALSGLLVVVVVCGYGTNLIAQFPNAFYALQIFGILFLFYIAFMLFKQKAQLKDEETNQRDRFALIAQGFLTSISNPNAWIFMVALLPQFLQKANLAILTVIILILEIIALCTYSIGGSVFRIFLKEHIDKLTKFSALCILSLGIFMLYELCVEIIK